jgi:hypothetical protein
MRGQIVIFNEECAGRQRTTTSGYSSRARRPRSREVVAMRGQIVTFNEECASRQRTTASGYSPRARRPRLGEVVAAEKEKALG